MKYEFNSRPAGKCFSKMIQLKMNIEKGLKCSVVTPNQEKIKRDFEYMTGAKLKLEPSDIGKDVYNASLTATGMFAPLEDTK